MKPRVRSLWLTHNEDQTLLPVRVLKFFHHPTPWLTCFLSASSLKAPNWQVNGYFTIHLLVPFGNNQSVLLSSSSTRTAGHSAALPNQASEIFGGNLWKQGPRHGSALGNIANIIFFSWRLGPGTPSCLTLSWFWPRCQGHCIKNGQLSLGNLITLEGCGDSWQWAEGRNSNPPMRSSERELDSHGRSEKERF